MLKKYCCMFAVCLLLLTPTLGLAEIGGQTFEPTLAIATGYTAEQWFDSDFDRALLTVLLALEYTSYYEALDLNCLYEHPSYVVYVEDYQAVMVCLIEDDVSHTIMYVPGMETAIIMEPVTGSSESAILGLEMAFELKGFEYIQNTGEALSKAVASANGAIEKLLGN